MFICGNVCLFLIHNYFWISWFKLKSLIKLEKYKVLLEKSNNDICILMTYKEDYESWKHFSLYNFTLNFFLNLVSKIAQTKEDWKLNWSLFLTKWSTWRNKQKRSDVDEVLKLLSWFKMKWIQFMWNVSRLRKYKIYMYTRTSNHISEIVHISAMLINWTAFICLQKVYEKLKSLFFNNVRNKQSLQTFHHHQLLSEKPKFQKLWFIIIKVHQTSSFVVNTFPDSDWLL